MRPAKFLRVGSIVVFEHDPGLRRYRVTGRLPPPPTYARSDWKVRRVVLEDERGLLYESMAWRLARP